MNHDPYSRRDPHGGGNDPYARQDPYTRKSPHVGAGPQKKSSNFLLFIILAAGLGVLLGLR